MRPKLWGTSKSITLQAGDTVHLGYGDINWKRTGSDGIVVYCVAIVRMGGG